MRDWKDSSMQLMKVSGYFHSLATLPSRNKPPDTRWIGSWVSLRAGLEAVEER
jgi:hypothetical protein